MRDLYDIAIIGAGPAGTTCALALRGSGLRVALVDKAHFPRDKVCGDAIPAICAKVLRSIDPAHAEALSALSEKVNISACRVVSPQGHQFDYQFQVKGYASRRMDFDHFLLQRALQGKDLDFIPGYNVEVVGGQAGNWSLQEKAGGVALRARLLIGADGANGFMAKHLAGHHIDLAHHCAAVRGYFKGVDGLRDDLFEIHLLKDYLPGYFWIFPVGNGWANVGFGMLSKDISNRRLSLRETLPAVLQSPTLAPRFRDAQMEGPIMGFGLPMGSRRLPLSGEGYLLCGDAGSLIEPATGEGIGNAMVSGKLAAQVAVEALKANNLGANHLKAYDEAVYGKLWKGLRYKYLAQHYLGERGRLLDFLIRSAGRPGPIRWLMRKVF